MSEPEIPQEWVALAAEVNRKAQCWNCNEEDGCDCMRAVLAAVAPLIRADERERRAKVVDALPVEEDDYTRLTYWMGYSDGKDAAASAIRGAQHD